MCLHLVIYFARLLIYMSQVGKMRTVLSFDVGIINLAYCLIDYNKQTKEFKILDWDIINLTDRDKMKCTECNANPSYYQEVSEKYYCKNHSKLAMISPPEFDFLFQINENCPLDLCSFEGKNDTCGKKSKYQLNTTYFCNTHAKSKYKSLCNSYKLVNHTKKGIDKMSMDDFLLRLIKELDKRPGLLECEAVFIENQPTMKNPRMKTISVTLYNYYTIRGIIDKHISKSPLKEVHFERWLLLFNETIDELFSGEISNQAKQRAQLIGWTIKSKIQR